MPNDGRLTNTHRLDVEYRMSSGTSLPPSSGSQRSISFQRMESGYQFIAASISDLACQQSVPCKHEINNNIIATIENE